MSSGWLSDAEKHEASNSKSLTWSVRRNGKGVLHTTEGTGWTSYDNWTKTPHVTVMPHAGKGVEIHQHISMDYAGRALKHTQTTETNRLFAFQAELIGTSDKKGPGYYWPDADDEVLWDLWRKLIVPVSRYMDFPTESSVNWKAYPASYGTDNGVRLRNGHWTEYTGWLGHQHVPQNVHGDPGDFPWDKMKRIAEERTPEVITEKDIDKIAMDGVIAAPTTAPDADKNAHWQMRSVLNDIQNRVRKLTGN